MPRSGTKRRYARFPRRWNRDLVGPNRLEDQLRLKHPGRYGEFFEVSHELKTGRTRTRKVKAMRLQIEFYRFRLLSLIIILVLGAQLVASFGHANRFFRSCGIPCMRQRISTVSALISNIAFTQSRRTVTGSTSIPPRI
ncbi:hypothetical protein SPHV1_1620004 [Novosphingobium sp. KN65.2]|nr:hypothetical protein SPHV1_1620004 [Novosphingobium sp. KN65.2]